MANFALGRTKLGYKMMKNDYLSCYSLDKAKVGPDAALCSA